ncbi:hypothetical protein PCO31111_02076 [Pandoraea communis]|uniref:Uncharacterized protein n=1 Tax=Pandoraea communis TaxID=2508297 RepID=A0A5E4ULB9_9BURK|nr:hypothetical protein PCO31111_02076 [Pandoraea communis]
MRRPKEGRCSPPRRLPPKAAEFVRSCLSPLPHPPSPPTAGAELLVFYAGSVQQPLSIVSPDTEKLAQDETVKTSRD